MELGGVKKNLGIAKDQQKIFAMEMMILEC
jgi:hypothetical protein